MKSVTSVSETQSSEQSLYCSTAECIVCVCVCVCCVVLFCTSLPVDLGGGLLMKLSVCSSQSSKGLETCPLEACSEKNN